MRIKNLTLEDINTSKGMKLIKRKVELRDNIKITTCSYFEAHKIILNNPDASYIIKPFDSDHMVCVIPEDTFPDLVEGTWEVVDYEDIPYVVEKGSSKRFYEYYRDGGSWDPEFYLINTLCQV